MDEIICSGVLILGSEPELCEAFQAVLDGLAAGRSYEELKPHYDVLDAAEERALLAPENANHRRVKYARA